MSFLRKIVRNDAVKLDPPEVYNWRVFALAAAVSWAEMRLSRHELTGKIGLLRRHTIRHGYRYHRRCFDVAGFQGVRVCDKTEVLSADVKPAASLVLPTSPR
jgi:hypothetical protein